MGLQQKIICVCLCLCVCACVRFCVCLCLCVCVCACLCVCLCLCVRVFVCVFLCACLFVFVCVCARVCVYDFHGICIVVVVIISKCMLSDICLDFDQESELNEVRLALGQEPSHFVVTPYQLWSWRVSCHIHYLFHFRMNKLFSSFEHFNFSIGLQTIQHILFVTRVKLWMCFTN
jgi:hypothetical protein